MGIYSNQCKVLNMKSLYNDLEWRITCVRVIQIIYMYVIEISIQLTKNSKVTNLEHSKNSKTQSKISRLGVWYSMRGSLWDLRISQSKAYHRVTCLYGIFRACNSGTKMKELFITSLKILSSYSDEDK